MYTYKFFQRNSIIEKKKREKKILALLTIIQEWDSQNLIQSNA